MKLIRTNDGLMGWDFNGKIVWCDTRLELNNIGWAHVAPRKDEAEKIDFLNDVSYALNHMAQTGHTIAHFGIFGTFMYTESEAEYEF